MDVSVVDAGPVLAIDITPLYTRALLFDVVEGRYRFIGQGVAPATADPPIHDVSEGIRLALDELSELTERVFIGADETLVMPSQPDGNGVDTVVAAVSVGPPVRVALAGLLDEVSLQSARHLSEAIYGQVVAEIGLNDRRKLEEQIDTLLHARPDILIVTGGTNGGASRSVLQIVEAVGLAAFLAPQEQRPDVLFAGNQSLTDKVSEMLGKLTVLQTAPNVRPALGVEDLQPAQSALAHLYVDNRIRQVPGMAELQTWSGEHLYPRQFAFGRVMRFLSHLYDSDRGVLGVELNAADTTVAAAYDGKLALGVYPDLGVMEPDQLLRHVPPAQIAAWVPFNVSLAEVADFVYNRALYPWAVPVSQKEMALEQALSKAALGVALRRLRRRTAEQEFYEPIVIAGEVFKRATPAQALMMILDGAQPLGITTLVMDQHGIMPALGAAAVANPILTVQVLESSAFFSLATVLSLVGQVKLGTPVLRFKAMFEETGNVIRGEVKAGALEVIPIPLGQPATLELQPLHGARLGPGRKGQATQTLRVVGGTFGVVIDARGRPIRLPKDPDRRLERLQSWANQLGG